MTLEIDKLKHFHAENYSDYTHLFGYLNPYYRTAYSIPKRKR